MPHLHFLIPLLFTTTLLPSAHPHTLSSDIAAIIAFKSSITPTSIPPWSCLASWNFSSDPCAVPRRTHFICGISCNAQSTRIVSLVLDPVGYTGTLTPLISRLTQLTHISLSDNSFHGQIPSSLSTLTNLQTLTLTSNFFSGNLPPSISQLKALQSIDISYNALTGTLPPLDSLSNLKILDLSFNRFMGTLPKLPPNLSQLALKANSLSGPLLESSFKGLLNLKVVELSVNKIDGVIGGWFWLLPSLQQINLANNSLTSVEIYKGRYASSQLVAVDLGFNQIEGSLPVEFGSLPLLAALSLRYNKFKGPIPREYVKGGSSLRRLYLDGNYLIGNVPAGLIGADSISGSVGNNCLENCPASLLLCLPSQKPVSVCKEAYGIGRVLLKVVSM